MMRNKYKITGFARLLIFMIFFAPLAYIGASYYQGEDGIEKIKSLFTQTDNSSTESQISRKKAEIKKQEIKLEELKKDLKRLERKK